MRKRLKFCLVAPVAALACLVLSGPALAGETGGPFEAGDPLTTNVPYVAWAGEEVRLVKCVDDPNGEEWRDNDAEWNVVDNSIVQANGSNRDPVFFDDRDQRTSSFEGGGDQEGRTCWAIDAESVHPGMARIKMALDDGGESEGLPTLKHDFLVIWLAMSSPVLTELGEDAFPGIDLGDNNGGSPADYNPEDCSPAAGWQGCFLPGLIRVTVTGSFRDLQGNARTLPADWEALAGRFAVDTDGYNPMRWDIHDDQLETEGHTDSSFCVDELGEDIDAVDNCLGSPRIAEELAGAGPFSRTIGGTFPTVGPFDPVVPSETFLPDGKLDEGDAPMPAARIDLTLTGGVGGLAPADKQDIYSRDRLGTGDDLSTGTDASPAPVEGAHNLYAPFYFALIPAVIPQESGGFTTSGTHGPIANNFPGYQTGARGQGGGYHYWDLLNVDRRGGNNDCFDVGGTGQFPDQNRDEEDPSLLPTGIEGATVYTDEHGEAIVQFLPEVGAAVEGRTQEDRDQGLCDLGEVNGAELLGTATINAEAMDPYQPTFSDVRAGNALVKNVFELAGKSLDCFPKRPIEAVCIETIRDIRGNPVVGAPVLFTADADKGDPGVLGQSGPFGNFDGSECAAAPGETFGITEATLCFTNADGQAGVVIVHTQADSNVDVLAENVATRNGSFGVFRDRCIRFAGNGSTLPTDGPTCANPTDTGPTTPPATNNGGTSTNSNSDTNKTTTNSGNNTGPAPAAVAAQVVSLAGNPIPAAAPAKKAPAKAAAATLRSAKLVVVKGKRYLVLRVSGSAATAKVRITLVKGTGKASKPVVRTIRTNRAVRVPNLLIDRHVRTVRVSVAK
jgi:hypothetical protein